MLHKLKELLICVSWGNCWHYVWYSRCPCSSIITVALETTISQWHYHVSALQRNILDLDSRSPFNLHQALNILLHFMDLSLVFSYFVKLHNVVCSLLSLVLLLQGTVALSLAFCSKGRQMVYLLLTWGRVEPPWRKCKLYRLEVSFFLFIF